MKSVENECVGCVDVGLPCRGDSCPNRNVVRFYCDKCRSEVEALYYFDHRQLCIDCVAGELEKVE